VEWGTGGTLKPFIEQNLARHKNANPETDPPLSQSGDQGFECAVRATEGLAPRHQVAHRNHRRGTSQSLDRARLARRGRLHQHRGKEDRGEQYFPIPIWTRDDPRFVIEIHMGLALSIVASIALWAGIIAAIYY
jgi:hypothetical protein